jgi:hypothetical protein
MSTNARAHDIVDALARTEIPALQGDYPDMVEPVKNGLAKLREEARAYASEVASIDRDPNLTEQGKAAAWQAAAHRFLSDKLAKWESETVEPYRQTARLASESIDKAGAFEVPTDPAERVAYEMRGREIRDLARQQDPLAVDIAYLDSTDPLFIHALENGPGRFVRLGDRNAVPVYRPLVDPTRKAVATLERARKANPTLAATLEKVQHVEGVYSSVLAAVRTSVVSQVPVAMGDPIAAQAAGA